MRAIPRYTIRKEGPGEEEQSDMAYALGYSVKQRPAAYYIWDDEEGQVLAYFPKRKLAAARMVELRRLPHKLGEFRSKARTTDRALRRRGVR